MALFFSDEIAPERAEDYAAYSSVRRTDADREIACSECGRVFYTDAVNAAKWEKALREGIDNPFVCDDCLLAEDELAYSDR